MLDCLYTCAVFSFFNKKKQQQRASSLQDSYSVGLVGSHGIIKRAQRLLELWEHIHINWPCLPHEASTMKRQILLIRHRQPALLLQPLIQLLPNRTVCSIGPYKDIALVGSLLLVVDVPFGGVNPDFFVGLGDR